MAVPSSRSHGGLRVTTSASAGNVTSHEREPGARRGAVRVVAFDAVLAALLAEVGEGPTAGAQSVSNYRIA